MRALALAFALAFLGGCVAPATVQPQSATDPVHGALGAFGSIVKVGRDGFEPVVRVGPDGTVYVAALQYVWVSRDNGTTFQSVDATGSLPIYASDSALAVAPDGRAYVTFDWPYAGETAACTSKDKGASWSCVPVVVPGATDRMWILAPTEKDAYLITGQLLDRPTFAVTHDAGASWTIADKQWTTSSQGADLAWDPVQKLVVEAASTEAGWGVRQWKPDGTPVGVKEMKLRTEEPTLAVDAAGTWWAVACANDTGDCGLAVAESHDHGDSWTRHAFPTQHNVLLPFVAASKPGRVAIGWYESDGKGAADATNAWRVVVAQTKDGASWSQQVVSGDKPVHKGAMCRAVDCLGEDRFAGDFLGLAFGPDDALHATWMRQTGSKGVPTTQLKAADWDDVEYARTP